MTDPRPSEVQALADAMVLEAEGLFPPMSPRAWESFAARLHARGVRVTPSPDAPGLLAALEDEGVVTWADDGHRARFIAALAASGDAPREGLDVERLARVLAARDNRRDDVRRAVGVNERDPSTPAEFMRTAEAIAREYASESHPTKEQTE